MNEAEKATVEQARKEAEETVKEAEGHAVEVLKAKPEE